MKLPDLKGFFIITGSILLITALPGGIAWMHNDYQWIFPLDDTYIHFSNARQVVETGIPGVSDGDFQFCTSSPLYSLLLSAGFLIFGVNQPGVAIGINLLAALWLIFLITSRLQNIFPGRRVVLPVLIFLVLLPLHLLILLGMEHTLQVVIALGLIFALDDFLGETSPRRLAFLLAFAALTTAIRYEGIFLVAAVSGWLIFSRHVKAGSGIALAGALPILIIGLYSLSHGGGFFPTSVLIKGHSPLAFVPWLIQGMEKLYENPFMLILLASQLALWGYSVGNNRIIPGIISVTVIIHLWMAEVGGYRYEAYLIGLGGFTILRSYPVWQRWFFQKLPSPRWIRLGLFFLLAFPFIMRAGFFSLNYPRATQNIYHQQIQMARFLSRFYPAASVAANDIGAITAFTDIRLTDLVGIGDREMALKIKKHGYNQGDFTHMTQKREVSIAIVHDIWVGEYLPEGWIKVREWTIPDNFICADETVSFYGVNETEAKKLDDNLRRFEPSLPEAIHAEDFYDSGP